MTKESKDRPPLLFHYPQCTNPQNSWSRAPGGIPADPMVEGVHSAQLHGAGKEYAHFNIVGDRV